ncbi:hypothetical protein F7725_007792, partial [Dissostichus mawsoni]
MDRNDSSVINQSLLYNEVQIHQYERIISRHICSECFFEAQEHLCLTHATVCLCECYRFVCVSVPSVCVCKGVYMRGC